MSKQLIEEYDFCYFSISHLFYLESDYHAGCETGSLHNFLFRILIGFDCVVMPTISHFSSHCWPETQLSSFRLWLLFLAWWMSQLLLTCMLLWFKAQLRHLRACSHAHSLLLLSTDKGFLTHIFLKTRCLLAGVVFAKKWSDMFVDWSDTWLFHGNVGMLQFQGHCLEQLLCRLDVMGQSWCVICSPSILGLMLEWVLL